jgi:hypothetical protein
MRRFLAIAGLALVACSQSQPIAARTPSPPGPTAAATPSQVTDLPVTRVDFSCRLPVVTSVSGADGTSFQGGFVTFPDGQYADDPTGGIRYQSDASTFATVTAPVLHGIGGYPFYDRAQSRWVPVPANLSLADGSAYAYATTIPQTNVSTAYIVNVGFGSVRSFNLPRPEFPLVMDFGPAGLYLTSGSALGGPGNGVWLLDPRTGNVSLLRDIASVWAVRDGYAWVGRFDSRDKTVWPPSELAPLNSLVRINLATGAETVWFYQPGTYPWLIGLDSGGRPLVMMGVNGTNQIRLIDAPGSSGRVIQSGLGEINVVQPDGERMWLGSPAGIYLYRPQQGFQKVFAFDAGPSNGSSVQPAGFCL